jgi:2-oxo-4-hydroxy-4-carboxy--5-ureidoimidazoline (OHCU) decarboxylase
MGVGSSAAVIAAGAMWRLAHPEWAGRALVKALGAEDENARTIAGMLLVKSGRRALPLLRSAMANREDLPMVLAVVGSIGDPSMAVDLKRLVDDRDPSVAAAARDALRLVGGQPGAGSAPAR